MFFKVVPFVFALFFSLGGMANTPAEMKKYEIDLGGGTIAPIPLPVSLVEEYRANFIKAANGIQYCKKGEYIARNPMVGKDLHYSITNGEYGCKLDLLQYSSWHYVCQLSKDRVVNLFSAMLARGATDGVLGDFSDKEKEVLYSECTMSRQ